MQQQHEKVRKKRDYTTLGGGYQNQRVSLLRNVAPDSRVEYRDTNAHNFFPDPLFKEQWYLVSMLCDLDFQNKLRGCCQIIITKLSRIIT